MKLFICALFLILVALTSAGNVVINGVCRDCSPPDAETVVVGDKVYKGRQGHGTIYINGGDSSTNGAARDLYEEGNEDSGNPYVVPNGFSGLVPSGSYVHNSDCVDCDIRG